MFSPSLAACLCPWLMAEVHFEQQRQPRPLPAPFHKNPVTLCSCSKKEKKKISSWKFSTNPNKVFAYAIACVVWVFITCCFFFPALVQALLSGW